MPKHITGLLILILLSGCASSHQANNHAFTHKKAIEEASWAKLENLAAEKCGVTNSRPPERSRAIEISNCVTGLVRVYVLPNAAFPDLLLSSRAEALDIAKDYAAGKISPAEYQKRSEDRLKNYSNSLIYFANQQMPSNTG